MKTEETKAIIANFHKLYLTGNTEKVIALLAEDIKWEIPGNGDAAPWVGLRKGRKEVREMYEIQQKSIESISFSIENILADGKYGVAIGNLSSRMLVNNKIFSSHFVATFTVSDGLITNYLFSEDSWKLVEILRDSNQ